MKQSFFIAFFVLACCIHPHAETYRDSSITFTYPAHWKLIDKNDSLVKFDAGKNFTFTIEHIYDYNGDEIKYAMDKKARIEKSGGQAVTENAALGNVFAGKMTQYSRSDGDSMRYVSYLYRDRRSYEEDPTVVSIISYGGRAADFPAMEVQFEHVYASIKFMTRRYEKPGKYYFDYPVSCTVKDFTGHIQYVTTNAPVLKNDGSNLKGFLIGETTPKEKATIDTAVTRKLVWLQKEGYKNIQQKDTLIGGKAGKIIHYQSPNGVHKRLMYVGLKGSLYWFSFDPDEEAEKHSFYEATDLIMSTFKFYD